MYILLPTIWLLIFLRVYGIKSKQKLKACLMLKIVFFLKKINNQKILLVYLTTLLKKLKRTVESRYPNTCAEVKLCLFLFTLTLEMVATRLNFLKQLVLPKYR